MSSGRSTAPQRERGTVPTPGASGRAVRAEKRCPWEGAARDTVSGWSAAPGHRAGPAVPCACAAEQAEGGGKQAVPLAQLPSASRGRRAAPARAKVRGRGTEDTRCPGNRGGGAAERGPADRQHSRSRGAAGNGYPRDPAPAPRPVNGGAAGRKQLPGYSGFSAPTGACPRGAVTWGLPGFTQSLGRAQIALGGRRHPSTEAHRRLGGGTGWRGHVILSHVIPGPALALPHQAQAWSPPWPGPGQHPHLGGPWGPD